jgi:hypothetical protein
MDGYPMIGLQEELQNALYVYALMMPLDVGCKDALCLQKLHRAILI